MAYEPRPDTVAATCAMQAARATARRLTRLYERHLAPHDLSASQFTALVALARGVGTVGALADALDMDRTTASRLLTPLRRRGLVAAGTGGSDRRVVGLTLTGAGRATLDAALPDWAAAQAEAVGAVPDWPGLRDSMAKLGD